MKKRNKFLRLNKLTIAKLNNSHAIIGGNSLDDGTDTRTEAPKCLNTSKVKI